MEQLIIVFTEKRNIGFTAIPYHASFHDNLPITLHEHVTMSHLAEKPGQYTDDEVAIVTLLSKISEQSLFKKYAREGTLKQFIDSLPSDNRFPALIKPFIEKKVHEAIKLVSGTKIKSYYKNGAYSNMYHTDLLNISLTAAEPVFYFNLAPEGLHYTLKVRQKLPSDQLDEFSLHGRDVEFLCQEPTAIKIYNNIYYFENTDWKKFKPFLSKHTITIPLPQVDQYMKEFVINCVRSHRVVANGFRIGYTSILPRAHLAIKKDLNQCPAIALYFGYQDKLFLADQKAPVFVKLSKDGDEYLFQKITRDLGHEKNFEDLLLGLGLSRHGDGLFRPLNYNSKENPGVKLGHICKWVSNNACELEKNGILVSNSFDGREVFLGKASIEIESRQTPDWFEIHAMVVIGEFQVPFYKFRKHLLENKPEYELPNGQLFVIPGEWFTRFSELFHYAKSDHGALKLPRSHFVLMEQVKHGIEAMSNGPTNGNITFPGQELPSGVVANLRPYQLEGYAWLIFLYNNNLGGILADDMGLGKTLQTITLLQKIIETSVTANLTEQQERREKGPNIADRDGQLSLFETDEQGNHGEASIRASLIVMPTSLVHNWHDEIRKFAPRLRVFTYTGNNRIKSNDITRVFNHYHVVLTTYGVLRNDISTLSTYHYHYLILDESQYVKNPASKIYDAVKSIHATHRLVLTGTPIENSLVDLWAQMDLVNKGLLGTLNFFKRHFVQPITKQGNEQVEIKLQKLIQPFILRRTKESVARDLPPVTEQVLYCDMTPEQESYYEREKSGIRNNMLKIFDLKNTEHTAIIALQALTRLRQIANHPLMIDESYNGGSGKFEQVLAHLESVVSENHNALVFSSFVKDLEIIEKELRKKQLKYAKLVGSTRERGNVIDNFNNNAQIFLISLKAGGVGLNLTKADYVFLLNPWWNPAAELQAISRAHRIGQTKNVFVYRFLSTGTIEEKIARLQEMKSNLANQFVNNNNPLADLSREEIMELFN